MEDGKGGREAGANDQRISSARDSLPVFRSVEAAYLHI